MKKLLITACALAAAGAYWLYQHETAPPAAPEADSGPPASTLAAGPAHEPPGAVTQGINTDASDDNTEIVLGLRVRKDRNCDVELRDYVTRDGEMFSAYTCTPREPREPHPYDHYSDTALEQLAYADAEAAALLGRRLAGSDHDKSYQLLIRATALDGDTRHLAWLGDVSFGAYRRDGELQIDTVKRRYELASLAAFLGEDPEFALFLRDELLGAGVAVGQIEKLDKRVEQLLGTVRDIQLTVYGEVRYGGQDDA